jgi:shikimate dehydrogenase
MSADPAASARRDEPAIVRLGLIGDNISRSRSPDLHRIAGELTGLEVTYDRLIPRELGKDFDSVFDHCAASGYRGINVTYPYKETVARRVTTPDPLVRSVAAVNTVVFRSGGPQGYNTDLTGFMAAYREAFGARPPGPVALIGAGGVGKAVAFGLLGLGAEVLHIFDKDATRASALAGAFAAAATRLPIVIHDDVLEAVAGAEGVVNCTPVGMVGFEGTPLPAEGFAGRRWAFDAVYTPLDTIFLRDAASAGLTCVSGFELFFHQGIQAFRIFTGLTVPEATLRQRLAAPSTDQGKHPTT